MRTLRMCILCVVFGFSSLSVGQTESYRQEFIKVIDALNLEDMKVTMKGVGVHGLNPKKYWTDDMDLLYGGQASGAASWELKAAANENYLQLLLDMNAGLVNPEEMGVDVKLEKKPFLTPSQLQVRLLAAGTAAGPLLESFAPQTAPYIALKESLRRIADYCARNQWPDLPSVKKMIKPGTKHPAIPAIKDRLRQLGYVISTSDDNFDPETVNAINDVQWMLRMKPDGMISPNGKTMKYLDVSCESRMRQIRLDMDKMRWFPQQFEDRYIFINLGMAYFSLVDKTGPQLFTMSFRTINGRNQRKSPTMKDKIVYVVINPFWVVPPTIFREDKVEEIRNLKPSEVRNYFDTRYYEVWNQSFTRRIDPTTIDWWNLDSSADANFFIRQKPHYYNALGVLKFMLTNSFAIYLHDTNQRELFQEPDRLLSSGCVRLERPMDLAEYLLKETPWSRDVIERYAAKPGEVLANDTRAYLKKPMPVYMAFLTSQLSSDGVIRFADDVYGQNSRMLQKGGW
ncbi:L,D-transpeptidase family protein [Bdellovibrio sp. 22V]|uniref:L,D-transpeptidase family protein n=1 Tax=Bdellovibrio TaxID=958 RepID=UPI0025430759|nr:L,D-transpeptidase family protein [Bdellovibrio sp. 22V]WII70701.1 L,D-transpeptidase family protein [Bdellovibrio sp. 22V]